MKALFIITSLIAFSIMALAQKTKQHFSQSIHDDGKIMHMSFNGDANGKKVNYDHTFNVAGMSKAQKDALTKRVTDSLGIQYQEPPAPPAPPAIPSPAEKNRKNDHLDSDIRDDGKTMHVKISGTKGKGTFSYSKNFNVKGLNKEEKEALVRHITDSLGIGDKVKHSGH